MKNIKTPTRILVVAVIAAVLTTAFGIASVTTYAAQQPKVSYDTTDDNAQKEHDSKSHPPAFAANDKLDHEKVTGLRIALRDLWADHVIWTRQYIVAAVEEGPDTDAAAERLLKNQEDIGDAIKPFYGNEAGDQLTSLLKDHILIAVDLLKAAKAGDTAGLEQAEEKWRDNANDIATFLSTANPNWPKDHLVTMLEQHLSLTKSEAVARLTGDYAADTDAFDQIHRQSMTMADELAQGIVAQFPEQFEVDKSSPDRSE